MIIHIYFKDGTCENITTPRVTKLEDDDSLILGTLSKELRIPFEKIAWWWIEEE